MESHEINFFSNVTQANLKLTLDDGTTINGKSLVQSAIDSSGKFNVWDLKREGLIDYIIDGYEIINIQLA